MHVTFPFQVIIDGLHAASDDTRARIVPRRKFAFSKRPGGGGGVADSTASVAGACTPAPQAPPPQAAAATSDLTEDGETIDGRTGELICIVPPSGSHAASSKAGAAGGRDLRLSRLTDCTVVLLEPLRALRVDGLVRCHVYTGGVAGSLLLHGCRCAAARKKGGLQLVSALALLYHAPPPRPDQPVTASS